MLLQIKMKAILVKILKKIGSEDRPMENSFTKCLRQEVAQWACRTESPECLQMAKFKLEQHLDHPELIK